MFPVTTTLDSVPTLPPTVLSTPPSALLQHFPSSEYAFAQLLGNQPTGYQPTGYHAQSAHGYQVPSANQSTGYQPTGYPAQSAHGYQVPSANQSTGYQPTGYHAQSTHGYQVPSANQSTGYHAQTYQYLQHSIQQQQSYFYHQSYQVTSNTISFTSPLHIYFFPTELNPTNPFQTFCAMAARGLTQIPVVRPRAGRGSFVTAAAAVWRTIPPRLRAPYRQYARTRYRRFLTGLELDPQRRPCLCWSCIRSDPN